MRKENGTTDPTCLNDMVAVEQDAHEDIRSIDDLDKQFARELEELYVNYDTLSGKEYRCVGPEGAGAGRKLDKPEMR